MKRALTTTQLIVKFRGQQYIRQVCTPNNHQLIIYMLDLLVKIGCGLWDVIEEVAALIIFAIIFCHIIMNLWPKKKLKLTGQSTIVIAGGCTGIGKQMARQFARLYHSQILIIDRRDDLFEGMKAELESLQCKPSFRKCDLSSDQEVDQTLKFIQDSFPKINLLVYNAGIVIPKRASEASPAQNLLVLKINYLSAVKMVQALEAQLQGGHIGIVSSMFAIAAGGVNISSYGASKGAIFHHMSSLRQEYKKDRKNISISIACPGAINTGMFHGYQTLLDKIVPILDQEYVAKRLVKQFVQRKEVCFIYEYAAWLVRIAYLLPSQIYDILWTYCDKSNYSAIRDKHEAQVKEFEKKS